MGGDGEGVSHGQKCLSTSASWWTGIMKLWGSDGGKQAHSRYVGSRVGGAKMLLLLLVVLILLVSSPYQGVILDESSTSSSHHLLRP
ncbi:hypothetical protein Tco_0448139 [Tanacetum coccineum]